MKVIGDIDCPNCKKEHKFNLDIEIPKEIENNNNSNHSSVKNIQLDPTNGPSHYHYNNNNANNTNSVLEAVKAVFAEEKKKVKRKDDYNLPSYIPAYRCVGCNDNHISKNYTQYPKSKCANCDQFNPSDKGKCVFCNSEDLEPIDEAELQELGIIKPKRKKHHREDEDDEDNDTDQDQEDET